MKCRRRRRQLGIGVLEDLFAVDLEAMAPHGHAPHQSLGLLPLLLTVEHGIDELGTGLLAHLDLGLALRVLGRIDVSGAGPHVLLARLEKVLELVPEPLAALHELLDDFAVLGSADRREEFSGALELGTQLDQELPEPSSSAGGLVGAAVVELGPVEDPFAERVGIEDRAEQDDGPLVGIPVLEGVVGRDASLGGLATELVGIKGSALGCRPGRRRRLGGTGAGRRARRVLAGPVWMGAGTTTLGDERRRGLGTRGRRVAGRSELGARTRVSRDPEVDARTTLTVSRASGSPPLLGI